MHNKFASKEPLRHVTFPAITVRSTDSAQLLSMAENLVLMRERSLHATSMYTTTNYRFTHLVNDLIHRGSDEVIAYALAQAEQNGNDAAYQEIHQAAKLSTESFIISGNTSAPNEALAGHIVLIPIIAQNAENFALPNEMPLTGIVALNSSIENSGLIGTAGKAQFCSTLFSKSDLDELSWSQVLQLGKSIVQTGHVSGSLVTSTNEKGSSPDNQQALRYLVGVIQFSVNTDFIPIFSNNSKATKTIYETEFRAWGEHANSIVNRAINNKHSVKVLNFERYFDALTHGEISMAAALVSLDAKKVLRNSCIDSSNVYAVAGFYINKQTIDNDVVVNEIESLDVELVVTLTSRFDNVFLGVARYVVPSNFDIKHENMLMDGVLKELESFNFRGLHNIAERVPVNYSTKDKSEQFLVPNARRIGLGYRTIGKTEEDQINLTRAEDSQEIKQTELNKQLPPQKRPMLH